MWPEILAFDFDGVLVDSVGVKAQAFGATVAAYPAPCVEQFLAFHYANGGVDRYAKFRHFLTNIAQEPATEERVDALAAKFAAHTRAAVTAAPEIAGASTLLAAVPATTLVTVLSATPDAELKDIINGRGWTAHFAEVLGCSTSKSEALVRWSVVHANRRRRLYIGDALSDFTAARSAGWDFIGVSDSSGKHPFPPQIPVVPDMHALISHLSGG